MSDDIVRESRAPDFYHDAGDPTDRFFGSDSVDRSATGTRLREGEAWRRHIEYVKELRAAIIEHGKARARLVELVDQVPEGLKAVAVNIYTFPEITLTVDLGLESL